MIPEFSAIPEPLMIAEQTYFQLENYRVEVIAYLGSFTPDVHSFKVKFELITNDFDQPTQTQNSPQLGLLRVGSLNSGLQRELEIRESLNTYGLIAPLIAQTQKEFVIVDTTITAPNSPENLDSLSLSIQENSSETFVDNVENINQETESESSQDTETEYLDKEYLPEEIYEDEPKEPSEKILLLTNFPEYETSLENFLKVCSLQENTLNIHSLNWVIQLCQCCSYLAERQWNLINLVPLFIEFKEHLKLYDLTQIFRENEIPSMGLSGGYCAPELATGVAINALMSSYTVGALLYQIIHHKLPHIEENFDLPTYPIPPFYQILKKVLSPIPERRLFLAGLRQLLLEIRQEFSSHKIIWETASHSTVGLSLERLQNEDNFGIRYEKIREKETLMIAMVADGIGGMAQGEIASKIAIETFLKSPIPDHFKYPQIRNTWLMNTFQEVNQAIAAKVEHGGTTLSVVLALNEQLMIAHVGDSRIYLLRQGKIKQLSQDHSLVSLLLNSGEITEEEGQNHPDRNVLVKSLGSKTPLREGHVQNLTIITDQLFLNLENQDILLLCSDGVWDLVSQEQLQEIFSNPHLSLQSSVDLTLEKVLEAGAFDNATLLALQCIIQ